jgi:hypothetical protein
MSSNTLVYTSDKLERGEPVTTNLIYRITGAKTISDNAANAANVFFDTGITQATVDAFLGTTNEILIAGFGSTAMGTDAFGGIIDMGGQCTQLINIELRVFSGTSTATKTTGLAWGSATALPNTLTSDAQLGANGNIGFKVVVTGVDAITDGMIEVIIKWRAK